MIFDVIGMVGVTMILTTYGLVQSEKLDVKTMKYSIINAFGAAFILISLWFVFNLSAFVIEGFWFIFSIGGIYKARKRNASQREESEATPSGT